MPRMTFRGVRGSMPVSGSSTDRHGGHTMCIEIETDDAPTKVLIDAGTGITRLDSASLATIRDYHVFLTHYHWDHIQGLLFFRPLFDATNTFTFYGHAWDGQDAQSSIEGALRPPWFPISIRDTAARKRYVTLERDAVDIGALRITSAPLRHPQGVTAYRVDGPNRSIVIATDCERGDSVADINLRELAAGIDVLVHDAQYSPDEYRNHYVGWGHSTWSQAVAAAQDAGARELVLVSHDPARTDDEIDELIAQARAEFPETQAAFEGMQLRL